MTIFRKVFRYTHFVLLSILLIVSSSLGSSFSVTPRIAGGGEHSIALKSDGTVWTWGRNDNGQLGNGTTASSETPVQVQNLTDVIAVAGGYEHTIALKSDGTVWTWGSNYREQFKIPVQVKNLTGIIDIAGGGTHSIALKSDGTVWAWGMGGSGQLGNGTTSSRSPRETPVQVKNLTDVIAVAGGYGHTIALKNDGTVWTWGRNDNGQLGNGTTASSKTPVQVKNLTDVIAVAGGWWHSIALKSDGTVWTWGKNGRGQLGNGKSKDSTVPVQVKNLTV